MNKLLLQVKNALRARSRLAIGLAAVLVAVVAVSYALARRGASDTTATAATTAMSDNTQPGSVSDEGSPTGASGNPVTYFGTLEPLSETQIIPDARGRILESPYEVGDSVSQGDLLIRIDDGGLGDNIELTRNSLARIDLAILANQRSLADLKVYAPADGVLRGFTVKQGDRVSATKLGEVVSEDVITATVPFSAAQTQAIAVGDSATLSSPQHMATIPGTVSFIYDGKKQTTDGSILYDVEIRAANPGGFAVGTPVSAEVATSAGTFASPVLGPTEAKSTSLMSRGSGYAKAVYAREGQKVKAGQLVLEIENQSLETTAQRSLLDRRDLEIKLRTQQEDLDACAICSPVSGVVTKKSYGAYDNITSTSQSVMTVANIERLTLRLQVYDRDVSSVQAGAELALTTDSDEYPEIKGTVASVDPAGKIVNGEKKHLVEITIDNACGLLPGGQAGVSFASNAQPK